jgi:hypothetical protein
MKTDEQLSASMPASITAESEDWTRGKADADGDRPPDRDGSAAYWKGYIAACFKDGRHG